MDNDSNHYTRLFRSFVSCKRIIGNLELTHINQTDVYEHYNVTDVKLLNETVRQQVENPFWFLNDLEEVGVRIRILLLMMLILTFLTLGYGLRTRVLCRRPRDHHRQPEDHLGRKALPQ